MKRTKYNESEDSIGIHYEESPYKQAIINESLNRFDNKIIMADPLKPRSTNLNNSLIHQNSIKEVLAKRSESPNLMRPITEPKEGNKSFENNFLGRKDLLATGKQNLPAIQSKSGNNIKTCQVNISSLDDRKFTPVRHSRHDIVYLIIVFELRIFLQKSHHLIIKQPIQDA